MQLNKKFEFLEESETLRLNTEAQRLRAQGLDLINLTAGELDFETPLYLQKAIKDKLRFNKYTPTLGSPELRALLSKKIQREYKLSVKEGQIAVTAGAKQALYELFQVLLNPVDEVIIPTPAWASYNAQVRLAGGKPIFVPLAADFDLDVEAIKKKLTAKTKAVVINSPHNPTGKIFSSVKLAKLAHWARSKNVFAIYDDVYSSLTYRKTSKDAPRLPLDLKHSAIVSSFSKSQALTGWRIGYLVASPQIIERVGRLQGHLSSNAAIISQYAAIEALRRGEPASDFLKVLKKRKELVSAMLRNISRFLFQEPDGAFYFFIDVSKIDKNSKRFCKRLLKEQKVMLVPGEAFGTSGFVRLSFAASEELLREGLKRLKKFVEDY